MTMFQNCVSISENSENQCLWAVRSEVGGRESEKYQHRWPEAGYVMLVLNRLYFGQADARLLLSASLGHKALRSAVKNLPD
jgi:hypothetical protein